MLSHVPPSPNSRAFELFPARSTGQAVLHLWTCNFPSVFGCKHIQLYCYQTGKQYCILAFPRDPGLPELLLSSISLTLSPAPHFPLTAPLFQGLVCRFAFEQLYFAIGFVVIAPKAVATDKVSVATNCFPGLSFPGLIWVLGGWVICRVLERNTVINPRTTPAFSAFYTSFTKAVSDEIIYSPGHCSLLVWT